MNKRRLAAMLSIIIILTCCIFPCCAVESENIQKQSDPADGQGVNNIVKRAYQMTDIKWTPKADIVGWNGEFIYKKGTTYIGLPYGQPIDNDEHNGSYVPHDTSLLGFVHYVDDSHSKMYTEQATYNKRAPYYSIDCSAFVSWAWGLPRMSTKGLTNNEKIKEITTASFEDAVIGDCLCNYTVNGSNNHAVLITDITYDNTGTIESIEISEATIGQNKYYGCQKTRYTPQELTNKYFNAGYKLYRYQLCYYVPYTHSCAVPLEGDSCTNCQCETKKYSNWDITRPEQVDSSSIETKTQYRYIQRETITSEEPSLSGYTLIGSEWVEKSSGAYEFCDWKFAPGFDKSHSFYSKYGKTPMKPYQYQTSMLTVTELPDVGYVYYHWCHGGDYNGPIGYEDYSDVATDTCDTFHAYYSTINPSASYIAGDGSYTMSFNHWCLVSRQFFRIPVKSQSYTEYKKLFIHERISYTNWTDEVLHMVEGKEVQERTMYRYSYSVYIPRSYKFKIECVPTLFETGSLYGVCACNKHTSIIMLPKLNIFDYEKKTITEATCSSPGLDRYTWNVKKHGDFFFDVKTYTTDHTAATDEAVAPTCTTAGLTEGSHCSVCNAVITAQETVPPLDHNYTSKVTPPTCTSDGYTTYTCSRCSYSYTETNSGSMGHLYSYAVTSKPNSSSTGTLTGTCSSCSNTTTVTLPKLNTTDYTRTIVTAATCTTNGTVNYTWNNTSYGVFSFTLFIYATGHSPVTDVAIAPTCTTAGLTEGSHCFICKEVIIAQETLAPLGHSYTYTNEGDVHTVTCVHCGDTSVKSHSYSDGLCICGEVENTAPVVDESIVINHTLNLASDISVNYVVRTPLLEGYEDYYLEVRVPNYEGNRKVGEEIVEITPVVGENLIYFTLTGVTAVQMNDELLATLYMSKGGKHFISKEDTYSIATYAYNQLNAASASRSLKKLCADLLCYGAAAQNYKGYRTDALVTENMTVEHMTHQSNTEKVTFGKTNVILDDISSPQITWVGKTLSLDSKVIIRFIFDVSSYRGKVSDLTLKLNYQDSDGVDQEVSLTDPTVYNGDLNLYCFDLDMLMAAELRTTLNVAVYEGEVQLSQTLRYSPDTYGNNKTGTLLAVCKALFAYSDSANAYFAN